jgi:hypothetical protein
MRRLLAVLLIVIVCRPLAAQSVSSRNTLSPGARVRVTLPDMEPREAVVVSRTPDTLVVRWRDFSNDDAVPFAAIAQLEVNAAGRHSVLKGATLGLLAGGAIGAIVGAAAPDSRAGSGDTIDLGEGFETAVGAAGGAAIGLVIGTLVGLSRSADWRAVSAEPGRLGVAIARGGQGTRLLASLRF